jgi:hypothetical protein
MALMMRDRHWHGLTTVDAGSSAHLESNEEHMLQVEHELRDARGAIAEVQSQLSTAHADKVCAVTSLMLQLG